MMRRSAVRASTIGIVTGGLIVGMFAWAIPAQAVERQDRGACSAGARYELEVERERTRLDISFSVDDGMPRERWNIRITNKGQQVARLTRTADSNGEWDFDRVLRDNGSAGRIVVEATSASGQTCRGSLKI